MYFNAKYGKKFSKNTFEIRKAASFIGYYKWKGGIDRCTQGSWENISILLIRMIRQMSKVAGKDISVFFNQIKDQSTKYKDQVQSNAKYFP